MMKKNFGIKALILLVVLAMTSGCIKFETGMKISATKDVEGFYIMGMMDSMMGQTGADANAFKSDSRKLEDQGYKVSDYKEEGYTGIKATKSLGNLDDLSYEGEVRTVNLDKADENTKYFKVEKGFLKNTYTAKFTTTVNKDVMNEVENQQNEGSNPDEEVLEETEVETMVDEVNEDEVPAEDNNQPVPVDDQEAPVDSNSEPGEEPKEDDGTDLPVDEPNNDDDNNISNDESIEQLKKMMNVAYKIELPTKVINSNATKVSEDGKILEWDLMDWKESSTIEFTFEVWNLMNLLIVGGGALLILIILIVIFVSSRKAKKQKETAPLSDKPIEEVTEEKESSVTPVAPTEGAAVLTPVGEATETKEAEGPVTLDVPKAEASTETIPEVTEETPAAVTVEVPKIVETPEIVSTTTEPQEAKTE